MSVLKLRKLRFHILALVGLSVCGVQALAVGGKPAPHRQLRVVARAASDQQHAPRVGLQAVQRRGRVAARFGQAGPALFVVSIRSKMMILVFPTGVYHLLYI